MRARAHAHTHTHTHIHACAQGTHRLWHTHAHVRIRTHTHTHPCMRTHAHFHTLVHMRGVRRFPATFTFVVRSFTVLDGIGKSLDARFDISEIAAPYARELLLEGSPQVCMPPAPPSCLSPSPLPTMWLYTCCPCAHSGARRCCRRCWALVLHCIAPPRRPVLLFQGCTLPPPSTPHPAGPCDGARALPSFASAHAHARARTHTRVLKLPQVPIICMDSFCFRKMCSAGVVQTRVCAFFRCRSRFLTWQGVPTTR